MSRKLYQIYAPHFTAGFITSDTGLSVVETAPSLKWLRGKSVVFAADWCNRKGYQLLRLDEPQPEQWEAASND